MNGRLVLPFFRFWVFFRKLMRMKSTIKIKRGGLCAASITDDAKKGVTVTSNTQDYEEIDLSKDANKDALCQQRGH